MKLGNYELLTMLAAGGMGTVHVARHAGAAGFERLVVIKRVHKHLVEDREFRTMFRNEAKISSSIRHPNVVPVIDVVENGSELFLVLEYVESISLSNLIRSARERGERLPPAVVSRILSDALDGLHGAHEATDLRGMRLNLVHRDVSPQNIIVGRDGRSRLIDFGIAKAAALVSATRSGELKGKLAFFSPEQLRRKELDRRADLFALGAVLYEALSGKRLFHGDNEGEVLLNILMGELPDVATIDPAIPRATQIVLQSALAQDRDERYQTADAFRDALEIALPPAGDKEVRRVVEHYAGELLEARHEAILSQVGARAPTSDAPPSRPTASVETVAAPASSRGLARRLLPLLAAVAVAASLVLLLVVSATRDGAETSPSGSGSTSPSAASAPTSPPIPEAPPATALSPSAASTETTSTDASLPAPRDAAPPRAQPPSRKTKPTPHKDLHGSPYR